MSRNSIKNPLIPPQRWPEMVKAIKLRHKLGFSVGQVAVAMMLSYSRVALVESGETTVSESFIARYRDALGLLEKARKNAVLG